MLRHREMKRKHTVLAYTAGIMDGEGSISIARKPNKKVKRGYSLGLVVTVNNTEQWLTEWLKMQYGGVVCLAKRGNKTEKPLWVWRIVAREASEFLKLVLPYLTIRRPHAENAIKFQEYRKLRGKRQATEQQDAVEEAYRILLKRRRGASD